MTPSSLRREALRLWEPVSDEVFLVYYGDHTHCGNQCVLETQKSIFVVKAANKYQEGTKTRRNTKEVDRDISIALPGA
jgi:hypothetical protein